MPITLVTGANRGLGLATVEALAREGHCVLLAGRDRANADNAAAKLRAEGLDVTAVELDVTSRASIATAAEQVGDSHGRLDVLVNNAGTLPEATDSSDHEFANPDLFPATFETNLFGSVAVTEAFLPLLRRSRMARIVNVSTTMGSLNDQANPDSPYYQMVMPAYQASKAALNSITISLAKKLANTDIKVSSVCPGFVQTDLTPVNKEQAPLTPYQAARIVVTAATLPNNAGSGMFFNENGPVPW